MLCPVVCILSLVRLGWYFIVVFVILLTPSAILIHTSSFSCMKFTHLIQLLLHNVKISPWGIDIVWLNIYAWGSLAC